MTLSRTKWILPLLWFFLSALPAYAEFYGYTDENGVRRYTDDTARVPEEQRPATPAVQPPAEPARPVTAVAPLPPPPPKSPAAAEKPAKGIGPEELGELKAQRRKLTDQISVASSRYKQAKEAGDKEARQASRTVLLDLHHKVNALDRSVRDKNGGSLPEGWEE